MRLFHLVAAVGFVFIVSAQPMEAQTLTAETTSHPITVRTETYPRQRAGEAEYYIYEQDGNVICTKFQVCEKDGCDTQYTAGVLKEAEDIDAGPPSETTSAVVIPKTSLAKHVCLTKFGLVSRR